MKIEKNIFYDLEYEELKAYLSNSFNLDEKKLLTKEAIGLLHVIRNQRNIFAHTIINPNTRYMRVIFLMAAFALLAEEIKQEY